MNYIEVQSVEALCKALGLPKLAAPKIRMQVSLVQAIVRVIDKDGLTHAQAAKRAEVGRTVITAVVNGNLDGVSLDRLVMIACRLGLKPEIKVTAA